ncbi:MAG: DUF4870 family protein [Candidatus Methylumidiphilus sp.]
MSAPQPRRSLASSPLKNLGTVIYALQAAAYAFPLTYFIAPLVVHWKRKSAQGTWLESHLRWQINTFWFSLAGFALGFLTLSLQIGLAILAATSMWYVFRIGQGWTRLSREQPLIIESRIDKPTAGESAV